MEFIGKCPPEPAELDVVADAGFNKTELYLERQHLDNLTDSIVACRNASVDIASVHTPHIPLDDLEYFELTDQLATEFDAFVVFHSGYIQPSLFDVAEDLLNLDSPYGYENDTRGRKLFEHFTLNRDRDIVLDVAHAYRGCYNPYEDIHDYLASGHVEHVHLCDATMDEDHLQIGEGDINLPHVFNILDDLYDGTVVLELMPEEQELALERATSLYPNAAPR